MQDQRGRRRLVEGQRRAKPACHGGRPRAPICREWNLKHWDTPFWERQYGVDVVLDHADPVWRRPQVEGVQTLIATDFLIPPKNFTRRRNLVVSLGPNESRAKTGLR